MPELPEVEHLRRTLEQPLRGCTIRRLEVRRPDVVRSWSPPGPVLRGDRAVACYRSRCAGATFRRIHRHGKQFAIESDRDVLCIHLGMTGQLLLDAGDRPPEKATHVHVRWRLEGPRGVATLRFRDPRRFGGLWSLARRTDLLAGRWSSLGPDALDTAPAELATELRHTAGTSRRPIKALLLDQRLVAGVGNIYADEALFRSGVHPLRPGASLRRGQWERLAGQLAEVLAAAVSAGGSSIRDYRDARGLPGEYAARHLVYGRANEPCPACRRPLDRLVVGGRSTVACPRCQPRPRVSRRSLST